LCHADENHIGHEWYAMAPFVPGGKSNGKTLSSFHIEPSYRTHFSRMSCSAGGASPRARPMVPHRSGGLSLTDGGLVFRWTLTQPGRWSPPRAAAGAGHCDGGLTTEQSVRLQKIVTRVNTYQFIRQSSSNLLKLSLINIHV